MPIMLAFRQSEYFQLCYSYKYVNILSKARFYINPGLVCIVNLKKYKLKKTLTCNPSWFGTFQFSPDNAALRIKDKIIQICTDMKLKLVVGD